jgi:RNA polymerase sigma-70 factor, ECF subfamily
MLAMGVQSTAEMLEGLPNATGNHNSNDDRSLVAKAKSGHEDAFGELYVRHRLKAYRTALRILRNEQDSEDAVQRAFQRALMELKRFREDSTFSTWLTRIVINEALMLLRQRRTRAPRHNNNTDATQDDAAMNIPDRRPTPEQILCENESNTRLWKAIAGLRENLKVVVLHKEMQGLTSVETARRLGLSVSAVKARTFHARRSLREHLQRNNSRAGASNNTQKKKA